MKRKLLAFSFLLLILGTIPAYGEDPSTETSSLTTDSSPIGQKLGEVTHTPTTSSAKMEGEGFFSPEEAAAAYISGLQENDISKMISAFAVETYAANYSLNQMVERLGTYMPSLGYIPPISEFSLQLNTEERRSAIVDAIKGHYLVLTGSGAVLGENAGIAVPLNEYSSSDKLLDSLFVSDDTPYLSQIRFEEEFIDPATLNPNYTSDIVQKICRNWPT